MTKTHAVQGLLAIGILLAAGGGRAFTQSIPSLKRNAPLVERREQVLVPSPDRRTRMRTTVLRPAGAGPFPLVLINHGSTESERRRATMRDPSYPALAQWFVARGYVVALPQRPGHGRTGGPYLEDQGGCDNADFRKAGLATADSIETALRYMMGQPYVRRDRAIIVGQSAGGWGAIALASRNPQGVSAVISFAGGRGGHSNDKPNNNCAPDRLVSAAGSFGRNAHVPTLWIYTENDSYFSTRLSRRMVDAYRAAGGIAEYRLLPSFGRDGHRLIDAPDGAEVWGKPIADFLTKVK